MAAEAIGKSQKRKNKMATYSCNFNYYTGLCYCIGKLQTGKSPSSVWFEPESGRGEYDVG